jgi:hypothetical protein
VGGVQWKLGVGQDKGRGKDWWRMEERGLLLLREVLVATPCTTCRVFVYHIITYVG